jgi:hypothetical protein
LGAEEVEGRADKIMERKIGFKEGAQIEGKDNLLFGIGLSRISECGLSVSSAQCSSVVPFPAFDLGLKAIEEGSPEAFGGRAWESDDVGRRNPIEISPYFATIDFLGSS